VESLTEICAQSKGYRVM